MDINENIYLEAYISRVRVESRELRVESREWKWEFTFTHEITHIFMTRYICSCLQLMSSVKFSFAALCTNFHLWSSVSDVICKWTFLQMILLTDGHEYVYHDEYMLFHECMWTLMFHSLLWTLYSYSLLSTLILSIILPWSNYLHLTIDEEMAYVGIFPVYL